MFRYLNKVFNNLLLKHNNLDIIFKIGNVFYGYWRSTLNSNYDPNKNGEYRVLETISHSNKNIMVIDVGANVNL